MRFYDGPSIIELGEFDKFDCVFTAAKVGRMDRNKGMPAFLLTVKVDGYASTTFNLQINETLFWE